MKTATYPQIGTKVKFCRQNTKTNEVEIGTSLILAICLDAQKRLVAHVQPDFPEGTEQPAKMNVDLTCLDPSDEFVERFKVATAEIVNVSAEGNGKVQEIVSSYNDKVTKIYTDILGAPIEFEA